MSTLAGSAIAQGPNVGRIDLWSKWKPTDESTVWLLLSGATNPPEGIEFPNEDQEMPLEMGMANFLLVLLVI